MGPRSENPDQALKGGLTFFIDTIKQCPDESFHEMTGKKGDVILMHPLMLHSASKNGRRLARKSSDLPQIYTSLKLSTLLTIVAVEIQ